ncbi:MAG: alpha/beta hydrolase [Anaerolineae bacterium]|nr:MAG: alpha/beta hydrolase [Anaerolineae bacterium]
MPLAAGLYYFAHEPEGDDQVPVILIHGAGGTCLHWPPEVRRLEGRRVYALDLPGHGKSEGIGKQSIEEYARVVVDFMKALKVRSAVVVGHSMGGAIALTLALKHRRRVHALGLVGTGARLRVAPAILESTASEATFETAVQMITDWAFGPEVSPELKSLAAQRMAETRPTVLHGDFVACDAFDVMDKLGKIRVPTLILCGTEDKLTPPRYSEYLREKIPDSRLVLVKGAGHMVMLEQPATVATALQDFLAEVL